MKEDITKLQNDLKILQQKYDDLLIRFNMHFHDGNNSQRVNFSDLSFVGTAVASYPTQNIVVSSTPTTIIAPAQPTGVIPVNISGKIYKLIYE